MKIELFNGDCITGIYKCWFERNDLVYITDVGVNRIAMSVVYSIFV